MKALTSTNVADVKVSMCPAGVVFFVGKKFPEECFFEHSGETGKSQESSDKLVVASVDNVQPLHMEPW